MRAKKGKRVHSQKHTRPGEVQSKWRTKWNLEKKEDDKPPMLLSWLSLRMRTFKLNLARSPNTGGEVRRLNPKWSHSIESASYMEREGERERERERDHLQTWTSAEIASLPATLPVTDCSPLWS